MSVQAENEKTRRSLDFTMIRTDHGALDLDLP
jgi:hypothetical protein